MLYKCTATTCDSKKVCLGLNKGKFNKQRYYDHVKSFKNEFYANSTTLSSNVWGMKKNVAPALTWEVLRTAKIYSNITKSYTLCLHEKLAIISYPYPDEHFDRLSELVTKCKHENTFLFKTLLVTIEENSFISRRLFPYSPKTKNSCISGNGTF